MANFQSCLAEHLQHVLVNVIGTLPTGTSFELREIDREFREATRDFVHHLKNVIQKARQDILQRPMKSSGG